MTRSLLVARQIAQKYNYKFDRMDRECDQLFVSVFHLDAEIKRLKVAMEDMSHRTDDLFHAQASLEPEIAKLSKRVFWSNLLHAGSFGQFRSIVLGGIRPPLH